MHAMWGPAHKVTILLFTCSKLALYLGVVFMIAAKMQLSIVISLEVKLWVSNMMQMFVSMLVGALDLNDTITTAVTVDDSIWGSTEVRVA